MNKIKSISIVLVVILLIAGISALIVACNSDNDEKTLIDIPAQDSDKPEVPTPEHQHTIVIDSAIPATGVSKGLTEGSHCSSCGAVIVAQEEIPALGFTVSFENYLKRSGPGAKLLLTNSLGKTEEIVFDYSTSSSELSSKSGIVSMQLAPQSRSMYFYYTMKGTTYLLAHRGSNEASEVVALTGDVSFGELMAQECILSESLVTMADGSKKALGDIVVGDVVLSYDWETMTLIENPVIYASSQDDSEVWTTIRYFVWTFSDGTVIKSAFAHRFYNFEQKKFVYLELWNIGDHVYKEDGTFAALVSCETVYEPCTFARITLQYGTNYFANGCLTGDRHCPQDIEF